MSSAAQKLANQSNAKNSTGPKTDEGKARSSQNARKLCLTCHPFFVPAADEEAFETFQAELFKDIQAKGELQRSLFDELAAAMWNLGRIRTMESELMATPDFLDDPVIAAKLDRLGRYKARFERTKHRNLAELRALQTEAALAQLLPFALTELNAPLASRTKITKRTQYLAASEARLKSFGVWTTIQDEAEALKPALEEHIPDLNRELFPHFTISKTN